MLLRAAAHDPLVRSPRTSPFVPLPQISTVSWRARAIPAVAARRQRHRSVLLPLIPKLRRPQRFVFVTNPEDVTPQEVDDLWTAAFGEQAQEPPRLRTPERWATVLRHSFATQAVFDLGPIPPDRPMLAPPRPPQDALPQDRRLIGFARCISDGIFAALICDVMVHPEFQGQGIGKKLMQALLKHVRRLGPSSFGVFPRPRQRMFFWSSGFRVTSKYRVMRYKKPPPVAAAAGPEPAAAAAEPELAARPQLPRTARD